MFIPWNTYLELKNNHNMSSRKLNLPLKIQGGTLCFVTRYFFLSQYFQCNQADIDWILNKVYVNVASNMSNFGFKGLLHILINPIFFLFVYFRPT